MVYELATILFYPDHEGVLKGRPSQCMDSLPDNRLGQIADEFIRMLASGRTEDVNDFYTQYVGTHLINKHPEGRIKSVFGRIQEDAGPTRIKQVLMIDRLLRYIWNHCPFQPSQNTQLGFRVTESIEYHHSQQPLGIKAALAAQHFTECIGKAQLFPKRGE